jgi:uncharacterized protein YutE (UPF0331/DUF86 family)
MDKQLLEAKLNQLLYILSETESWINAPAENFGQNKMLVRACQRNLQLLVEYASDINGLLVLELGNKTPGSYRESFSEVFKMAFAADFSETDKTALIESVEWRNELIHEYEPKGSDEVFLNKLKQFLTAYKNYARLAHKNFI